jgi:alginate O-acetyltransferase complex protein AlgI
MANAIQQHLEYGTPSRPLIEKHAHRDEFAPGVAFFSVGLAKKVLLANPCGKIAALAFEAGSLHPHYAWYAVTAYAL